MNHSREKQVILSLDPKKSLPYLQMTAAAYRKEFRKSLKDSQNQSLKPLHSFYSLSFFETDMMATTSITMPAMMTSGAATILRKSNIA